MAVSSTSAITHISDSFIKPKYELDELKQPIHVAPLELHMLSCEYTQKGFMFRKPQNTDVEALLESLKESISLTITHFYPLGGQLVTQKYEEEDSSSICIDCTKGPGARLIHATIDMSVSDVISPRYVPQVVHSFFDHEGASACDGHYKSLLSVQVTELVDGIFMGCSINHMVADGTSYCHFLNVWSEIHRANGKNISISQPPVHKRWFPDGFGPIIKLPVARPDDYVIRNGTPGVLRERIFHFSSESVAALKAKANAECGTKHISSFMALAAFAWRSITRARSLPRYWKTTCCFAIDNRQRLNPSLSQDYFGSYIQRVVGVTTVGKLLEASIGSTAMLLQKAVLDHDDQIIRNTVKKWMETRVVDQLGGFVDPCGVVLGGSPKFDVYSNEFGLGKAIAVLSGKNGKSDGKMVALPGWEGGGSIDLEITLSPASMTALESDQEFMQAVTSSPLKQ
ncbi:hypothetical protein Droror1_Dr00005709 [Drosera rotundifolia]